jgi:hypothetical protein
MANPIIAVRPIIVLDDPVIETNDEYKYARAVMQVWTGILACEMRVYSSDEDYKKHDDLKALKKGDYEVDAVELRNAKGQAEVRYMNARPRKQQTQQAKA